MKPTLRLGQGGEMVIVDDSPTELDFAWICHRRSRVANELRAFSSSRAFLEYLELVKTGGELVPELVLLDVEMPEMDGFETLRRVRDDAAFRTKPPIVLFSATSEHRARAEALGVQYEVKPVYVERYVELFRRLALEH